MHYMRSMLVTAAVAAALGSAGSVSAEEATTSGATGVAGGLEEVVVTAQRRTESIQDVPLSVMAVTADTLQQANIRTAIDLTRMVPNLRINRLLQSASMVIRVRGVGTPGNTSIDPSVAPFIDGAYIPRPGVLLSNFLDVETVEVLRGPQGTLFGRNATAGALQVNTRAPSFDGFEGEVYAEYGDYDAYKVQGIVNVPVSDTLALRFAGVVDGRDGYMYNKLDGEYYGDRESLAGRVSARWQPTDSLTWTVRLDYADLGGDGLSPFEVDSRSATPAQLAAFTTRLGGNPPDLGDPLDHRVKQVVVGDVDDEQWGFNSDLTYGLQSGHKLRWIGAYRDWRNDQLDGDVLATPLDLLTRTSFYDSESMSQELQFISPEDELLDGRLDYVTGLYYFQEDYSLGEDLNLGTQFCGLVPAAQRPACAASSPKAGATQQTYVQDAESFAVYGELKFGLTDSLDLTVGGRWTSDDKTGDYVQLVPNPFGRSLRAPEAEKLEFDDDQFTYRVVLSWFVNEDQMLFANYSTGYKSGGMNSAPGTVALGGKRLFDSEDVDNVELGAKTTWVDNRLIVNATLYRMDIDNFQDRSFDGTGFVIRNAGSLRQQGLELEGQAAPIDSLRINFAMAYLDSEFTSYPNAPGLPGCTGAPTSCPTVQNLKGAPATFAPEWQFVLGGEYRGDFSNGMSWSVRADWNYVDEHYAGGQTDANPQTIQEAYDQLGARITLFGRDEVWSVALFGENLTNEVYVPQFTYQPLDSAFGVRDPATGATLVRNYASDPRTWGVGFRYRF
jgi:iron complex outermembrane receptor protein